MLCLYRYDVVRTFVYYELILLLYQQVVFDLMKDIFNEEKIQYIDFCDYPQGTSIEDINVDTIVADTLHYENKYERLKNTTNAMVLPNKKFKMVNYMLVDIHRDSLFFEMVNKAKTESINDEILNAIATPGEIAVPQTLLIVPPIIRCYSKKKERVNARQRQSEEMFRVITSVTQKSNIKVVVDDKLIPKKTLNTQHYNEIIKWQWQQNYQQTIQQAFQHSSNIRTLSKNLTMNIKTKC